MSALPAIALGLLLGALGALWHLFITRKRALGLPQRGATVTLLLMPVGLAGPAAAVLLAAQVAPAAAWATVVGLFLARTVALWRLKGGAA